MTTEEWGALTYEEKNKLLYDSQKKMLDEFLKRRAISQEQYDEGLRGLEKMGRDISGVFQHQICYR